MPSLVSSCRRLASSRECRSQMVRPRSGARPLHGRLFAGEVVYNPMRVIADADQSEVMFTLPSVDHLCALPSSRRRHRTSTTLMTRPRPDLAPAAGATATR
jgi:hypothetical protein